MRWKRMSWSTYGILFYTMYLFYRLREINNYSDSIHKLITKQLRFLRKPYELWLIVSSISAIILITNVNLIIDNDNGAYVIHNKVMFVGVTLGALLFIYGAKKKYIWLWLVVFILLTAFMIFGILTAIQNSLWIHRYVRDGVRNLYLHRLNNILCY